MVATDTVVGIVGAVVLVAVMGGVFVYEYNQDSVPSGDGVVDSEGAFAEACPRLDANEDIDLDGLENHMDEDIDGDGVIDDVDNDTMVMGPLDASLAAGAGEASLEAPVFLGTGHTGFSAEVEYQKQPGNVLPIVSMELRDADGEVVLTGTTTNPGPTGGTATLSMSSEAPLDVTGTYTIVVVVEQSGGVPVDLSGMFHVAYDC